ncbi:peptidase S28 [Abortiporus biennis]|nr:peptidase S28 [Abortiporus biennis]
MFSPSILLLAELQHSTDKVAAATPSFPQYNFTQPLDHFSNTGFTFQQRYWVSDRHYVPGGPVFILDSGESSGIPRLAFLDTGIVDILTSATGGLGIVLEHRYYGSSVPVANFTTDSLRWLNNEQALADSANFMANVKIPNITQDITAPKTPWIYYGGSYAGARSAHMKVAYPDIVYGAIASSGVTFATIDDWQYYDIIRQFAPRDCIKILETAVIEVDELLSNSNTLPTIKAFFGLGNVTHVEDFASVLSFPLGGWQNKNWDPAVGDNSFAEFCDALGTPNNTKVQIAKGISISADVVKFANYINSTVSSQCSPPNTQDDCFGTFDPAAYQDTSLRATWRLWQFQVCTQWGFFMTAPPDPKVPRIVSNFLTLDYAKMICEPNFAYPPGSHFVVPPLPNITDVNSRGGLNIAADRLAIIDGQEDPWRPNTPHSDDAKKRPDTPLRPFKLISGAVHHYDENGLSNHTAEPPTIRNIHQQEVAFVKAWLEDFKHGH